MVSSICWRNIGISFIDLGIGPTLNECKSPDYANDPPQSRARRMLNVDQFGRLFWDYCLSLGAKSGQFVSEKRGTAENADSPSKSLCGKTNAS